jgi:hypothetical protein
MVQWLARATRHLPVHHRRQHRIPKLPRFAIRPPSPTTTIALVLLLLCPAANPFGIVFVPAVCRQITSDFRERSDGQVAIQIRAITIMLVAASATNSSARTVAQLLGTANAQRQRLHLTEVGVEEEKAAAAILIHPRRSIRENASTTIGCTLSPMTAGKPGITTIANRTREATTNIDTSRYRANKRHRTIH